MLIRGIKGIFYYLLGHVFAFILYDKKYIDGKWFEGKLNGLCATGWKWVVQDGVSRFFGGNNKDAHFPVNQRCIVICPNNIEFDANDLNNFHSFGIYYQAIGKIKIGKGTYIGPNVGLITANHDIKNLDNHSEAKPIVIGAKCWIGMNSVVLPGVKLGDGTIVGAGAVVTKSFPEGHCIIAGNPARIIRGNV